MGIKHFGRYPACLLALAVVGLPAAAGATARVYVEWRRNNVVYASQSLSVSGTSLQSSAAPDFGNVAGEAHVKVIAGAIVVTDQVTATQGNGRRIQTGEEVVYAVAPGAKLAAIEATDQPPGSSSFPTSIVSANPAGPSAVTSPLAVGVTKAAWPSGTLVNGWVVTNDPDSNTTIFVGAYATLTAANGYKLKPGQSVSYGNVDPSTIGVITASGTSTAYGTGN